jgi:hypothetical protein
MRGHTLSPVAAVDVYVDDFLLLAQERAKQQKVMRAALTAIDAVFRLLALSDSPHRKEPALVKKMLKGDAQWSTRKRTLGWDLDTRDNTLHLPQHRVTHHYDVLDWLQHPRKRLPKRLWHKILGELWSVAPALPGMRGLFSVLQAALSTDDRHRVRINQQVYDTATDFRALVDSVSSRPMRLQQLVPTAPSDIGACDSCRYCMGGVWFDALDRRTAPIVWRQRFPSHVANDLVTADHRSGTLSISDLELWTYASHNATSAALAAAACLIIGFFFLLRPCEYLGTPRGTQLCMRDVRFWIRSRALDQTSCPEADISAATFVTLTFMWQRKGVRNETVGHGRSGHPHLCPVHCLTLRVLCLRLQGATLDTPLNAVRNYVPFSEHFARRRDLAGPCSLGPPPGSGLPCFRCVRPLHPCWRRQCPPWRRR